MASRLMAVRALPKRLLSSKATSPSDTTFLANGVRVVSLRDTNQSATVGLYFDGGSRSENTSNNGAGYLASQLVFKGTNSRSQSDFAAELASIGGLTRTSVDRERTAYSITANSNKFTNAAELLIDATLNPAFSDASLAQEQKAVLNAKENLEELTMDALYSTAYQNSSLAFSVKGSAIGSLTRQNILDFSKQLLTGPQTVFAASGDVDHATLVKLAEKYLGSLPSARVLVPPPKAVFVGSDVRYRDDFQKEAHIAIAVEGPGLKSSDSSFSLAALAIAKEIVGYYSSANPTNPSRTPKLAQEANTYRYANSYSSFLNIYSDTSLFGCYATCPSDHIDDFVYDLQQEWMRITRNVSASDIARAKKICLTNFLIRSNSGTTAACDNLGTNSLSFAQFEAQLQAVDVGVLKSVMDTYFYDQCPAVSAVGPIEALTDYNRIRSNMFWLRV